MPDIIIITLAATFATPSLFLLFCLSRPPLHACRCRGARKARRGRRPRLYDVTMARALKRHERRNDAMRRSRVSPRKDTISHEAVAHAAAPQRDMR